MSNSKTAAADAVLVDPSDQFVEMSEQIAPVVETSQLIGQRKRQAAPIILLQPVLQPLAADLGGASAPAARCDPPAGSDSRWRRDRGPLARRGKSRSSAISKIGSWRKALVGAALRDQPQRVAARHRQAGDDQLGIGVRATSALRRSSMRAAIERGDRQQRFGHSCRGEIVVFDDQDAGRAGILGSRDVAGRRTGRKSPREPATPPSSASAARASGRARTGRCR